MPILSKEIDLYPENLLEEAFEPQASDACWWAIYTMSRREKDLMRRLKAFDIPFYGPIVPKRTKSPAGRKRTSYIPLFHNYVFMHGNEEARYDAMTTNCVSKYMKVVDGDELRRDLKQIRALIDLDVPMTIESQLKPGQRVRIRTGRFLGFEGTILRREKQVRLLVSVNFLQQGASLLLDDFEVEAI